VNWEDESKTSDWNHHRKRQGGPGERRGGGNRRLQPTAGLDIKIHKNRTTEQEGK